MINFDIVGKRKISFTISLIVLLAGIIGFIINGIQLDIQFQGGTIIQIQMPDEDFNSDEIQTVISEALGKNIVANKLETITAKEDEDKVNMLTLKVSKADTLTTEELNKVIDILHEKYNVETDAEMNVQNVQPFIGAELLGNGVKAAILASILIVLYVWKRFSVMSGLSSAVIAVLALVHDAFVMFTVYILFRIPVNESFIAAILTILGYSINATIIIYDRIRENTGLMRKASLKELVNTSINQTFARSINTTITTFIAVVCVYIFAAINNIQSLTDFTFPLIIGLISGTFSSLCLVGPVWVMWEERKKGKKLSSKTAKV
ncbi:MAG TPA: protein translocase subunit SecF [Clostridiaceae bacterium]|nr:protein translocase subunit SecF [Clostridiaceae bacterium]